VQPLLSERLGPADPSVAAANRSAIFHALQTTPACLGLNDDDVAWFDDGDYAELHQDDAADIRNRWLPWLAGTEAGQAKSGTSNPFGGDPERLWTLEEFIRKPSRDPQVIAAIEGLLNDATPCRIEEHYIGEVRLLAAMAAAAARSVAGRATPVRVTCVPPLRAADLLDLSETAGLPWPTSATPADRETFDAAVAAFALLRDRGLITEHAIEVMSPFDLQQIAARWASRRATDREAGGLQSTAEERPGVVEATSEDIAFYVRVLSGDDQQQRALALRELALRPTGDAAVREAVERLLADDTPCVLQIPYRFGELRLLAAGALAAERAAIGDRATLVVHTIRPLDADQLEQARQRAQIPLPKRSNAVEMQLAVFAALRSRGLLQETDVEFPPGRHQPV
jgi:hypothetical protein